MQRSPKLSHRTVVIILVAAMFAAPGSTGAQSTNRGPAVAVGYAVDTLTGGAWGVPWQRHVPAIYRRWAEFLTSSTPRYTMPGGAPSPFWVEAEQRRWITFPLALSFVSPSAQPMVVEIRPAAPGTDSVFVVKTMFMAPGGAPVAQPTALVRVYAVRLGESWVFSNALPRLTNAWRRQRVGPFEYVIPPGYRFDPARARSAAAFADSVASAFDVPKLARVEYFLTPSPDEMYRLIGLDWLPASSDGGAFSSGPNRLLVSGDPSAGEAYRHEIAHVVLAPLASRGVHPLLWEGVATWLGGTLGMSAAQTRREYATYLRAHPEVTLDSILTQSHDRGLRPAGAALVQILYERGGVRAVKAALTAGYSDVAFKSAVQRELGRSWSNLQMDWRQRALRP
jgi:hypothetical protein